MKGRIRQPPLPDSPRLIEHLCDPTNTDPVARHFREHINKFNVALSMGTLTVHQQIPPGRGPPVVMLNGQLSQQIGNVFPGTNADGRQMSPLFGQVYALDDIDEATDARLRSGPVELNRGLMHRLEQLIRQLNPFARNLASLGQQMAEAEAGEGGVPGPRHYRLSILDNRPVTGEVYALFDFRDASAERPDPSNSGIWLRSRGNELMRIDIWNRNTDWLLFPLMFPRATQTYGRSIPLHNQLVAAEEGDEPAGEEEEMMEQIAGDSLITQTPVPDCFNPPPIVAPGVAAPGEAPGAAAPGVFSRAAAHGEAPGAAAPNAALGFHTVTVHGRQQLTAAELAALEADIGAPVTVIQGIPVHTDEPRPDRDEELAAWNDDLDETDMEIPATVIAPPIPNDLRETLSEDDVRQYEQDPVEYQITTDMLLATSRWVVRNQSRPTVVVNPNFFAGYYNYMGDPRTEEDMARDLQSVLDAPAVANAEFFNRFTQMPELIDTADGVLMIFRENFAPDQPLEDAELIVIPVMLHRHFAMAIWDRFGDVAIHYYDSLGWRLQNGTRDKQPHPLAPNIEQDLLHIVRTIMGDRAPIRLEVREHHLEHREHNQQNDVGRMFNCGLYALLNVEAYLFQGGNCYIEGLNIDRERSRFLQMLKDLLQPTLPFEYVPPNFDGDSDLFVVPPSGDQAPGPFIGNYVPYHTDMDIDPVNVEVVSDGVGEDETSESEPFIAEGRVVESLNTYRPRTPGLARFASRRDWVVYHMQRRGSIHRQHAIFGFGRLSQK
jgi:hypothetical protein